MASRHVWQEGVCTAEAHAWQCGMVPQQILQDSVNERVVHILLECILVLKDFF